MAEIGIKALKATTSSVIDEVEGGALPVDVEGGVCVVVHGQDAEIARRVLTRDRID